MINRCFNAFTGITFPTLGVITSFQDQLDTHLRTASLVVGLLVGLVSLYRQLSKIK
jgi:hypothetical protein